VLDRCDFFLYVKRAVNRSKFCLLGLESSGRRTGAAKGSRQVDAAVTENIKSLFKKWGVLKEGS